MKKDFIQTEHLTFRYDSEDAELDSGVLTDVSITIKKGEFLTLLGRNGSGKSTLAKLLNAMLVPTHGKVFVQGMDTMDEEVLYEIRRRTGLVFQNPDHQLVASIVEEDVAFGPENLGIPPAEIRQRVDDALRMVDMSDYCRHAPHKLSGGQKQRVAIAGIIAMLPDCIVLDEPTAMLDPRGRREVLETIHRLNREKGITILLITHYMDEAVGSDRIMVMDNGRILAQGTPREIFSRVEMLKAAQLDVPQATELAYLLKKSGFALPDGILTPEECVEALCLLLQ